MTERIGAQQANATVRPLVDPHVKQVTAVIEELFERAGRIPGLILIVEEIGRNEPRYCLVGRFRSDPAKAIGHLAIMQQKVTDFAADLHEGGIDGAR